MILAGGTATAWHLSKIIKKNFVNDFILCIGDVNPQNIIPSSTLCDEYFQLSPIISDNYYSCMLKLFQVNKIDIVVPLIDFDLTLFANNNSDLLSLGVVSTAPNAKVMEICKSKKSVTKLFSENEVDVPKMYTQNTIRANENYFVKPDCGFGSQNAGIVKGKNIDFSKEIIIQEILDKPEITVEIFKKDAGLFYICRERLETKAGVCTKARFFDSNEIDKIVRKISTIIDLPLVSCIQFMKNQENKWCITDLNLRLGAGTALSSTAGFCISSAFLSVLSGKNDYESYLHPVKNGLRVVRVYNEMVMP
jgi:carbamoylphosphate synthase large subunit